MNITRPQAPAGYEADNSLDIPWNTKADAEAEAAFLNAAIPSKRFDVKAFGNVWYVAHTAWLNPVIVNGAAA